MSKEISGERFEFLEVMDQTICLEDSEKGAQGTSLKQLDSNDNEDLEATPYFSDLSFFQEHEEIDGHQEEVRFLAHMGALNDLYLDIVSPPFQALEEDITMLPSVESRNSLLEPDEERTHEVPSASLAILRSCRSRLSTVNGNKVDGLLIDSKQQLESSSPLSTNYIIELAAGNFIRSNSATTNELFAVSHPYATSLLGLLTDTDKDVQLVQDLLSCAEKVGNQQYNCASKRLEKCSELSSNKKSTIQRLVHCFTEALREKIDRETGRFARKGEFSFNTITPSSTTVALQTNLPVLQVAQFTCVQTIMDHLSISRKVHIIDLEIHCGTLIMILMQELASRSDYPLEHFKITAVTARWKSLIEEAGLRLKSMAESLKIKFSFHLVLLEDFTRDQQSLIDQDAEEAVIVHATHALQYMISKPYQLETLMRRIKNTNPRVMIITETESNVNSPIFVTRFVEALFFYGAYFDCMEDCLKNDAANRTLAESSLFNPSIRNIVAAEGEDRNVRTVSINIWRMFFARFGMVEIELSKAVINQANLIRANMGFGDSCTLGLHGNSLLIGWKRTPICSISAWKFHGRKSIRRFRI